MHPDDDCFYAIGYTVYTSRDWFREIVLHDLMRHFFPYCCDCGDEKVMSDWTEYCVDCYWDHDREYRFNHD